MKTLFPAIVFVVTLCGSLGSVRGDTNSIGPKGINAVGLGLTGADISIGQVDLVRSGDPGFDDATNSHSDVDPQSVFFLKNLANPTFTPTANSNNELLAPIPGSIEPAGAHGTWVAGVMIANPSNPPDAHIGVATGASLRTIGFQGTPGFVDSVGLSAQYLATLNGGDTRAINMSFGNAVTAGLYGDGNSQTTLFTDWSAAVHNVLYVTAAKQGVLQTARAPQDHFNGLNVASSQIDNNGVFRVVAQHTNFVGDDPFFRTTVDLLAPGTDIAVTDVDDAVFLATGNSFAAPHVTATAALLLEFAAPRTANQDPGWSGAVVSGPTAERHEVMKAVLMNSADKLIDDGTVMFMGSPIEKGRLLGMDRTVETTFGNNWLSSSAFVDIFQPLDQEMGAGHLNARRAIQQYRNGEYAPNATPVPMIGWSYSSASSAGEIDKFVLNQPLLEDSFISVTLAWDREVAHFDFDSDGAFDVGEVFDEGDSSVVIADDQISDLELHIVPKGGTLNQAIASSILKHGSVDHIFAHIPQSGEYEIWVEAWSEDFDVGVTDYGIAWWAVTSAGDFNADNGWGEDDVNLLTAAIASGSTDLTFDMNADGVVNLDDLTDVAGGWLTAGGAINTDETSGLPFLAGDANLDGNVDGQDFIIWNTNKFDVTSDWTRADFNANGVVDGQDFIIWNTNKFLSSATVEIVPEPALSHALLGLLAGAFLRRKGPAIAMTRTT